MVIQKIKINKDIWLEWSKDKEKVLGWTNREPVNSNRCLRAGTVLQFFYISNKGGLNYRIVGNLGIPEFIESEIIRFIKNKIFEEIK